MSVFMLLFKKLQIVYKMTKMIFYVDFIWKQCTSTLYNGTGILGHMTKLCDENVFRTILLLLVFVSIIKKGKSCFCDVLW